MLKGKIGIMGAAAGLAVSLLSALQMIDHVRLVEIVTLFAGGMGAGVGLVKAVIDHRRGRENTRQPLAAGAAPRQGATDGPPAH